MCGPVPSADQARKPLRTCRKPLSPSHASTLQGDEDPGVPVTPPVIQGRHKSGERGSLWQGQREACSAPAGVLPELVPPVSPGGQRGHIAKLLTPGGRGPGDPLLVPLGDTAPSTPGQSRSGSPFPVDWPLAPGDRALQTLAAMHPGG